MLSLLPDRAENIRRGKAEAAARLDWSAVRSVATNRISRFSNTAYATLGRHGAADSETTQRRPVACSLKPESTDPLSSPAKPRHDERCEPPRTLFLARFPGRRRRCP